MDTVTTIARTERPLVELNVAIIGDGNRSLALGSILSMDGHEVRLWTPDGSAPSECEIRERNARVGHTRGKTNFRSIGNSLDAAVNSAAVVILSSPASKYGEIINSIAGHLTNGQTVVLSNAPLGASLQFIHMLDRVKPDLQIHVLEMGSLYDSVKIDGGVVLATGPRQKITICGKNRNETRRGISLTSNLWDGLMPASNILERGLTEVERILVPILHLFHRISAPADAAHAGVTDALQSILMKVEAEVQSVAREYQLVIPSFGQVLADYWGATGSTIAEQVSSVKPLLLKFAGTEPSSTGLTQEICETIVLVESLARLAHIQVPLIDAVIRIGSVVTGCDLQKTGRSVSDLGLMGYDVDEIIEIINQ